MKPTLAWLGLFLVPLALLAGCELLLRSFWPQAVSGLPARLFEERDGLAFLRPGLEIRHRSRDFRVAVSASSRGYRAGTGQQDLDDAVWVLGDSFAFGWGVEAADTATALLAHSGWKVFNAAMPGDGLPEYARRLRRLAETGARPRVVLVLLFDNDLAAVEAERRGPSELVQSIRSRSERRAFRVAFVDALVGLHVANLVGRGLRAIGLGDLVGEALGFSTGRERLLRRDLALHQQGFLESVAYAVQVRRLEGIVREAQALGAAVVVVRIVAYGTGGGAGAERSLELLGEGPDRYDFGQIDRALAQVLSDLRVTYGRFPAATAQLTPDLYFPWDGHLSVRGQARLAAELGPVLERALSRVHDSPRLAGIRP